jgi:hypothetical protein
MNSSSLFVVCLFVSLASGCATHAQNHTETHADGPQTPLVVTVEEVSRDASGAEVKVVIRKLTAGVAAAVQLDVPPGVSVSALEGVVAADFVGERSTVVRLGWSTGSLPAADFKVVAKISGNGLGAIATGVYRFGRPEPRIDAVPTGPLNLQVGALRLGDAAALEVTTAGVEVGGPGARRVLQRH